MNQHTQIAKDYIIMGDKFSKQNYLSYRLEYLIKFVKLKNLYLKKVWSVIISRYWKTYLRLLRKYDLMYSLNQYKFNKQTLLPVLSNILNKIIGKKIEYNIINLKSIAYNTDLFTNALSLKLKKSRMNYMKSMLLKNLMKYLRIYSYKYKGSNQNFHKRP